MTATEALNTLEKIATKTEDREIRIKARHIKCALWAGQDLTREAYVWIGEQTRSPIKAIRPEGITTRELAKAWTRGEI